MPLDDGAGLNQAKPSLPSLPGLRKPGPKGTVQRRQAWAIGAAIEDQKLVVQSEILEEQVSAGLKPGKNKTKPKGQPTDHALEDSRERPGNPAFSACTEFLPTTRG